MKTVVLLSLVIVAAALMGCTTDPCNEDCCGRMNANCCGWEFYKPCNPIRSQACGYDLTACPTRVVLKDCAPIEAAPEEAAPAAEAAEAGTAEFGGPADDR